MGRGAGEPMNTAVIRSRSSQGLEWMKEERRQVRHLSEECADLGILRIATSCRSWGETIYYSAYIPTISLAQ